MLHAYICTGTVGVPLGVRISIVGFGVPRIFGPTRVWNHLHSTLASASWRVRRARDDSRSRIGICTLTCKVWLAGTTGEANYAILRLDAGAPHICTHADDQSSQPENNTNHLPQAMADWLQRQAQPYGTHYYEGVPTAQRTVLRSQTGPLRQEYLAVINVLLLSSIKVSVPSYN